MLLRRIFERRTSEGVSLHDAQRMSALFGIRTSSSGVQVSETTAHGLPAFWACVELISSSASLLSVDVSLLDPIKRTRMMFPEHAARRLFGKRPNRIMTPMTFRQTVTGHLLSGGNGYVAIIRDGGARPVELLPLDPRVTYARQDIFRETGELKFQTMLNNTVYLLDDMDVLHFVGYGYDGFQGYSPVRMHAETLGVGLATQEFSGRFFSNGATLSGVLEYPGALKEASMERISKDWDRSFTGVGNAQKTAVLENGMKYTRIGVPPDEAQFIETRKMNLLDIARLYRVPAHMVLSMDASTNNNIEHQGKDYVQYCLLPWLRRIEEEVERKLLTEAEKDAGFEFRHNVEDLLRGDSKARSEFYKALWGLGAYTINDVRAKEGDPAVPNGDVRFVPVNMAYLDESGIPHAVETPKKDPSAASENTPPVDETKSALYDALDRVARAGVARAILRKMADSPDPSMTLVGIDGDDALFERHFRKLGDGVIIARRIELFRSELRALCKKSNAEILQTLRGLRDE